MDLPEKINKLKEDIDFVRSGVQYSERVVMNEAYPSNPSLGEMSSVYTFIVETDKLLDSVEELIKLLGVTGEEENDNDVEGKLMYGYYKKYLNDINTWGGHLLEERARKYVEEFEMYNAQQGPESSGGVRNQ